MYPIYEHANEIFDIPKMSKKCDYWPPSQIYNIEDARKDVSELLKFADDASPFLRKSITETCREYTDVFSLPGEKLTHTTAAIFHLPMKSGSGPIHIKQFRTDVAHTKMIRETIANLEKDGVIEKSFSPYNFPIFLRPKPELNEKGRQKMRMCVDFSRLNSQCVPYFFPLPRIDEVQEKFLGKKYLCSLDLSQGYHQVLVTPADRDKLVFTFDGVHWQYQRVPFGLSTISGFFQTMMNNILSDLLNSVCQVYVDDVIIMADTEEELIENVRKVLDRLRQYNFKLNPQKCRFGYRELKVLGHICSAQGIRPDPASVEKVKKFPVPTNKKKLQAWLGLANYYRKFIPNFADIADPQYALLSKNAAFNWDDKCQQSFEKLKEALNTEPVMLFHPDTSKKFEVCTDASSYALGAVLEQEGRVASYASKTLTPTERRYNVTELKSYSIVFAVENWRHFLTSRAFTVFSDHRALAGELRKKSQSSRLMRYKLRLSEYDFEVIYRKEKDNGNADSLSRADGEIKEEDQIIMVIMVVTRSMTQHLLEALSFCS